MSPLETRIRTVLSLHDADHAADDVMSVINTSNQKKLKLDEVRTIRMTHRLGATQAEIADAYGINPATVSRIISGDYW